MYKNNSRNSSEIKDCSPLKFLCNLTGKCNAVGYYSYTSRCVPLKYILKYEKMDFNINMFVDSHFIKI